MLNTLKPELLITARKRRAFVNGVFSEPSVRFLKTTDLHMILNFYDIVFATFFIYCQFSCFEMGKKSLQKLMNQM